ncbi:DNA polymerase III subunit delta [Legionella hackeliae]|uniref:DNA polymerase III subunit delta n=1 Tax=Legionella hackeliae TaxID=449 RepID=A0A0A8UQ29_LEGHA|nr:DNA polymerase III subunit delta [Legionella hackeliae]KTD09804.1 DNA polymerase III, delta subunit [Legionella hackeliae]CEK10868.1 DNA polymerase III, delta subunit [Legionella hackeliae]STX47605.1 DNA polymerase III, delta subunit [Legionella hackeliae]
MLIKQQALGTHLARNPLAAIYILIGQDHFLLTEAASAIKKSCLQKNSDTEETIIHINSASDWSLVDEKANSYSLFSSYVLLDVRYEKQTLEAAGKNFITKYLNNINSSCLLLIRAPQLGSKQLQSFINHDAVHVVQIFPLDNAAMQHWIKDQLQKRGIKFEADVPALIFQYTQGNMLACAQALDKIQLIADESLLTSTIVKEQLIDQCSYQLFDLSDACLLQDANKVIQHLRHANTSGVEPTLILWLLAQDIRNLLQLGELTQQSIPFTTACSQLKIWTQKSKLYQSALKRLLPANLIQLLQFCKNIDEQIKSNQNSQVWPALERVALSLCLGKQVGTFA